MQSAKFKTRSSKRPAPLNFELGTLNSLPALPSRAPRVDAHALEHDGGGGFAGTTGERSFPTVARYLADGRDTRQHQHRQKDAEDVFNTLHGRLHDEHRAGRNPEMQSGQSKPRSVVFRPKLLKTIP